MSSDSCCLHFSEVHELIEPEHRQLLEVLDQKDLYDFRDSHAKDQRVELAEVSRAEGSVEDWEISIDELEDKDLEHIWLLIGVTVLVILHVDEIGSDHWIQGIDHRDDDSIDHTNDHWLVLLKEKIAWCIVIHLLLPKESAHTCPDQEELD